MNSLPLSFADDAPPPHARRSRRPQWVLGLYLLLVGAFSLCGGVIVLTGIGEGYCFVWPSIGTRFASDYNERGFNRVQLGMTKTEVVRLIGTPLSQAYNSRPAPSGHALWRVGDETWQYANDSSALGGDWAWLSREIVFRQGVVTQKVRWIYYD